jgi:hypothetical protein
MFFPLSYAVDDSREPKEVVRPFVGDQGQDTGRIAEVPVRARTARRVFPELPYARGRTTRRRYSADTGITNSSRPLSSTKFTSAELSSTGRSTCTRVQGVYIQVETTMMKRSQNFRTPNLNGKSTLLNH